MKEIKTINDWWENVDTYWSQLQSILWQFLPMAGMEIITGCGEVKPSTIRMAQEVDRLKRERDRLLGYYFEAAWESAPNKPEIHFIPGWGVLCDLCSEQWVFEPEEEVK